MIRITFLVSLVFFLGVLTAFGQRSKKAEADILAVMDAQTAAWNRGDIEGFMKGYWNSDQLVFVSGDEVSRGRQPTLERYKKNYATREKMGSLSFTGVTVELISNDAAVALGSWSLTRAADSPKGKFTLIFRKFKDGWRIVHDHTS
ncbi:MAG: DUF4440 domain-containing protein [Acidobacteriota bacterium]